MPDVLTRRKGAPANQSRDFLRVLALKNLYRLGRDILHRDRPEAEQFMSDSFHRPLALWAQTQPAPHKLVLVPRDHLKTSLLTVARNIQRILNDPNIRILLASNKAEAAEAMLSNIKRHLEDPFLIWLFPEILHANPAREAEKWTNSQITVKRTKRVYGNTIDTIGVEGETTSKHYDHGTFDDLVGLQNSLTREELQKTIQWYRTAQSLFEPKATQDVIGTPWHYSDLYAWLLEQRDKHNLNLAVYMRKCWEPDPNGVDVGPPYGRVRPTLPEKFTIPKLLEIKTLKGTAEFAAQYLIDPVDDETAVFPRSKARIVSRKSKEWPADEAALWTVMTVDPAISQKGWADYIALAVAGFDYQNSMYVRHLDRGRWTETRAVDEIFDAYNRYKPTVIGIEPTGFQVLFLSLLTREGEKRGQYLPIVKLDRDTKTKKATRIRVLEPLWNAGQLILADDLPVLEEFLDEAARFRLTKDSTHDDMLDALADCMQLRIRPQAPDPLSAAVAAAEPQDAEMMRYMIEAQTRRERSQLPPLDDASLRMAWLHKRHLTTIEHDRRDTALGVVESVLWE